MKKKSLPPERLRPVCDPKQFTFTTTGEITNLIDSLGQGPAQAALEFGIGMNGAGYNLYALGPTGLGKRYFIRHYLLHHVAAKAPAPSDWCYVNNFKDSHKPTTLKFPPGEGIIFKEEMKVFIDELLYAIPAMFESKEYAAKLNAIEEAFKDREEIFIRNLQDELKGSAITILGEPGNYEVIPLLNNERMTKEQLDKLSELQRNDLISKIKEIENKIAKIKSELPAWYKMKHQKEKELELEFSNALVTSLISELKIKYTDPKILDYLRCVQQDIIESPMLFVNLKDPTEGGEKPNLARYQVNVIVSNDKNAHAPIIFEPNPDYVNLVGQLEGTTQEGALTSDFNLIRPGSIHKANGGYLMLEVSKVIKNHHAWSGLIRILAMQKITIDPLQQKEIAAVTQLQPEPIPLNLKVILLGDRSEYEQLGESDEDFKKLFKVLIEFETTLNRTDENIIQFVQYIARMIKRRKLNPFHRDAIASIIDYCIRLTGESQKIILLRDRIVEILEESNYWAKKENKKIVEKEDVEKAIEMKIKRVDKIRREYYEDIARGFTLIDVKKKVVGQINGISVIDLPNFTFGLPVRITATTRSGKEGVIDIQREVNLGGSIHSKGVLILSGFIKGRYAKETPFSLSASVVFEQNYALIDGDSASVGELCALISSLADVSIKQSFAVTGAVNQHGLIQSVGAINEKIEAFFDNCLTLGLTGKQGVIIPASNVKNLMLKQEIVESSAKGTFHIYPIHTIDEALKLLTGIAPSVISRRCEATLQKYAESRRRMFD